MTCKKGGFICVRHDEVRDLTSGMLREVCNDVSTEPLLLPLDGEHLRYRTANASSEAGVDVSARGFWTRGQVAFLNIRIFDPMAAYHRDLSLEAAHQRNEHGRQGHMGKESNMWIRVVLPHLSSPHPAQWVPRPNASTQD